MAEEKKGVILYCDIINTVEKLKDSDAGKLFKHYLRYVNDQNPEAPSQIVEIVFEPIKQQLKRDLKKWEERRVVRSKAGKISAEKRKQNLTNSTHVESVKQATTNPTVIVTDTVTVKVKKKKEFIPPSLEEFKNYFLTNGFSQTVGERAWKGYDAAEWHDSMGNKVRNWKQKCQNVWFKDENKIVLASNTNHSGLLI